MGTTEANGRELPVKDLWRWIKQMFKVWKRQDEVISLKDQLKEAKTFRDNISRVFPLPNLFRGFSFDADNLDEHCSWSQKVDSM